MKLYIVVDSEGRVIAHGTTHISMSGFDTYEIEVAVDHEVITNPEQSFAFKNNELIKDETNLLEKAKQEKALELNHACSNSILAGFKHTINGIEYHFSFDFEAQLNFQGAERLLSSNMIPEIMWTVQHDGVHTRIPINKQIMGELTFKILQHKDRNISRYRDFFMPILNGCETLEEVQEITWQI